MLNDPRVTVRSIGTAAGVKVNAEGRTAALEPTLLTARSTRTPCWPTGTAGARASIGPGPCNVDIPIRGHDNRAVGTAAEAGDREGVREDGVEPAPASRDHDVRHTHRGQGSARGWDEVHVVRPRRHDHAVVAVRVRIV